MIKPVKFLLFCNFCISMILWLLGTLTLLFNLLGMWTLWHLAGFAFALWVIVCAFPLILSTICAFGLKSKKYIIINLSNIAVILFTVFVSATWMW